MKKKEKKRKKIITKHTENKKLKTKYKKDHLCQFTLNIHKILCKLKKINIIKKVLYREQSEKR